MTKDAPAPETGKPSSLQHGFRISLNLTRRVVRRMIELEQAQAARQRWIPKPQVSNVPDPVSFQFSLRVLRRVVHRIIEQGRQAGNPLKNPQPA